MISIRPLLACLALCASAPIALFQSPSTPRPARRPNVPALLVSAREALAADRFGDSMRLYAAAAAEAHAEDDKQSEGRALIGSARAHAAVKQTREAVALFRIGIPLVKAAHDLAAEEAGLTELAAALDSLHEAHAAVEPALLALSVAGRRGDVRGRAAIALRLADRFRKLGSVSAAAGYYRQAADLAVDPGDNTKVLALSGLATAEALLARPREALVANLQVLSLPGLTLQPLAAGAANVRVSAVYTRLGRSEKAAEYADRAAALFRDAASPVEQSSALVASGRAFDAAGRKVQALDRFTDALGIARAQHLNSTAERTLEAIGAVYLHFPQPDRAIDAFRAAMALDKMAGSSAGSLTALNGIAEAAIRQGDLKLGVEMAGRALSRARAQRDGGQECGAQAALAEVARLQGHAALAIPRLEAAMNVAQTGANVAGGVPPSRMPLYDRLIGLLDVKGRAIEAWEWADRARAQALREDALGMGLDRRALAATDPVSFVPPMNTAILAYVLPPPPNRPLVFCATQINGRTHVAMITLTVTRAEIEKLSQSFRGACSDATGNYKDPGRRLYKALVAPVEMEMRGRKRLVICPVGTLWSVPFEALMMTQEKRAPAGPAPGTPLRTSSAPGVPRRSTRTGQGKRIASAGQRELLVPSVRRTSKTRIRRAAANSAGPARPAPARSSAEAFLGDRFDITYAAGSAMAMPPAPRYRAGAARPLLALISPALADDATDRGQPAPDVIEATPLAVAREVCLGGGSMPVPGAMPDETEALRSAFSQAVVETGPEARALLVGAHSTRFRCLHLYAPLFFNDAAPLMSSVALAADSPSAAGAGFLTARDILDREVPDLVVLSGSGPGETGFGSGRGLAALITALHHSGAAAVAVGRWSGDDSASALFARTLYAGVTHNLPYAAAIRHAVLTVRKHRGASHPYYWARYLRADTQP